MLILWSAANPSSLPGENLNKGMIENLVIRSMKADDLDFAASCTAAEEWVSEDRSTFESFFQHDPNGCLIAEQHGKPLGICIATSYGHSGFIGELIVQPAARGQGLGATLLNWGVAYLHSQGAATIYLDGVLEAVPLYERIGFKKICRSLRFSGKLKGKRHPAVRLMKKSDLPAVFELDRRMFGADRSFFLARRLEVFPQLCQVLMENETLGGFIMGRQGDDWVSASPWVVSDNTLDPQRLLESLVCENKGIPISAGILASNKTAVNLVRKLGFTSRRKSPWRMALGTSADLGASIYCLAIGSAAKG
jgi:ribosomal protein S18 acetylase RimI-like enzyme